MARTITRGRRPAWAFVVLLATLLVTLSLPRVAAADNLADEAQVEFELGAARYKAGDFLTALEHFLASNRLAPNRNVVFNIARAFEQLGQNAEAYRYYHQALDGEPDARVRQALKDAIVRVSPHIGILRVETDPPGAAVYI